MFAVCTSTVRPYKHNELRADLVMDCSANRHPVMEDPCLEESHDSLISPDPIPKRNRSPTYENIL